MSEFFQHPPAFFLVAGWVGFIFLLLFVLKLIGEERGWWSRPWVVGRRPGKESIPVFLECEDIEAHLKPLRRAGFFTDDAGLSDKVLAEYLSLGLIDLIPGSLFGALHQIALADETKATMVFLDVKPGENPAIYRQILRQLAAISSGAFRPQDIRFNLSETETGNVTEVTFDLDGKEHRLFARDEGRAALNFLDDLNAQLPDDAPKFRILVMEWPLALVVRLAAEEEEQLRQVRGAFCEEPEPAI